MKDIANENISKNIINTHTAPERALKAGIKAEISQAIYNAQQVKCAICGTKAVRALRAGTIHMNHHICSSCLSDIKAYTSVSKAA